MYLGKKTDGNCYINYLVHVSSLLNNKSALYDYNENPFRHHVIITCRHKQVIVYIQDLSCQEDTEHGVLISAKQGCPTFSMYVLIRATIFMLSDIFRGLAL